MLYEKRLVPDPRLTRLIEMIGECDTVADIGSDHGRLGACLLQMNRCRHVVMTDISDASLQKARKLVRLLGLEDRVTFSVGDGLSALNETADVIVIAGMGGETIASILSACEKRHFASRFLLQANVAIPQLRTALVKHGFMIKDECLVREGRRIYTIIEAQAGKQELNEVETEIGPILLAKRDPLFTDYADFRLRVIGKALNGANQGADKPAALELERRKRMWEEARNVCKGS